MQRNFIRKLIPMIAVLVLLAMSMGALSAELAAQARPDGGIRLKGDVSPLVHLARLLRAADTRQSLNISVGLSLRNSGELDSLLSNLYNPASPQYHQFLTPGEFAAEFGPTPDQQQQVVDYIRNQGLTVTGVSPNGTLIDVRGTIAQVKVAFHVAINEYQLGTHKFYANSNEPTIPSSISSLVASIAGLDNAAKWHPEYHLIPMKQMARAVSHPGYAPADLKAAYDSNALGTQGKKQTVAIFELDGYKSSDITQYLQAYNLGTPSITNVYVDGFNGSAGSNAIEDSLDIEVVAAMAPQASQIVYEGPNTTQGVNDTYNKIVTDNKAQVMTTSWGLCEAHLGTSELQALDNIFKQGAAQGISMYAASGDNGAYDCQTSALQVDSPASDPYVTGTGGTTLNLSNGSYGSETVWNNGSGAGGGGLSTFFSLPGWQTGPGVSNLFSNGKREVPDVSADADPNTGHSIYCTAGSSCNPNNPWIEVGGTSGAAPLWAGTTAIINEYLQNQGKGRIGFANPVLYGLENAQQTYVPFHDITVGDNLYYPATANYDLASGWGSPDIYNLGRDIANGVNTSPSPSPSPTATPSPTPSPTATPSPTPSPTATPSPTPICFLRFCFYRSPSPSPSPTATPSPTPICFLWFCKR